MVITGGTPRRHVPGRKPQIPRLFESELRTFTFIRKAAAKGLPYFGDVLPEVRG
jgi:hypothetical protein